MSGGSMGYLSYKVADATFANNTARRRAFRKHLFKVAEAMHAIEWNDSGDGHPREDQLIDECIGCGAVLEQAIADAEEVNAELMTTLALAKLEANRAKP